MIRPVNFSFNSETAVNNAFQVNNASPDTQAKARKEFNDLVYQLQQHGIHVTVIDDTPEPYTPDSIFPNNWVSFHDDGTVVLYPMFAENRRAERKQHVLDNILRHFEQRRLIDLSGAEADNIFLEGTGSMVLDRDNRIAYTCLSPRTNQKLVDEFCRLLNFTSITFYAHDQHGGEIYHTNVMMCVADQYVVVCLASITDPIEKSKLLEAIAGTNKKVVDITLDQMNSFAGNMLQVSNNMGDPFLVMSSQAYHSLTTRQREILEAFNPIIHADIGTIETNGGGSARCMMAEVFLPEKSSL
jgi:hypothetical protein